MNTSLALRAILGHARAWAMSFALKLVLISLSLPALLAPSHAATATSTALASSLNPSVSGAGVTFTASVTGASPTGSVTFKDSTTTLGTAVLSPDGKASLTSSTLSAGVRSITAVYEGDANNAASTSAKLSQMVNKVVWHYGHDAMGRLNTVVDPNNLTTYTYYDSLGRPIQTSQPPNTGTSARTLTNFEYNKADALTRVSDPRNLPTLYSPDGLGNVTAQTSPDTGASSYTHDASGNVLSKRDARGKLTKYTYDSLNRLTGINYASGTDATLAYDGTVTPPATSNSAGELTKITDASGSTSYTYDSAGRLTSKTQITGSKTFVVRYTWGNTGSASAMDKLTSITYPSGTRVNYSYDVYGAVSSLSVNPVNANGVGTNTAVTVPLLSAITYNADSLVSGWSWASGNAQAISYSSLSRGRVSAYNLGDPNGAGTAAGLRRSISRDSAGRIRGYTHTNGGVAQSAFNQSFDYDSLNRLTSASLGTSALGYSYDATGNRTVRAVNGTDYPNTIAAASNRLVQLQDAQGTHSVVHDAAGNITGDGVYTYAYGDHGRMSAATTAAGSVAYGYNALGQRVSKSGPSALVPSGAAYFVYDEAGQLLGEYDASGAPLYETAYLGAVPVGVIKQRGSAASATLAVSLYNVWADHLGTPRVITRPSDEAIVWRWDGAEPFGASAPNTNPSALGAFVFNQRFAGQVFDAETGLLQNWHRDYNPRLGRYMQSDPIGLEGGINTYAYVGGNPLGMVDPMGLAGEARTPPPTSTSNNAIANARVPGLIREIQRYNSSYSYPSVRPTGSGYTSGDVNALQEILTGYQKAEICPTPNFIYRGGTAGPSNLTPRPKDNGFLSTRDSLSNPWPLRPGQRPVLPVGEPIQVIDTSRLPPGSVIPDGQPYGPMRPGHVSVGPNVPAQTVQEAIVTTIPRGQTR
jgi:RHS repeat-associated protein